MRVSESVVSVDGQRQALVSDTDEETVPSERSEVVPTKIKAVIFSGVTDTDSDGGGPLSHAAVRPYVDAVQDAESTVGEQIPELLSTFNSVSDDVALERCEVDPTKKVSPEKPRSSEPKVIHPEPLSSFSLGDDLYVNQPYEIMGIPTSLETVSSSAQGPEKTNLKRKKSKEDSGTNQQESQI